MENIRIILIGSSGSGKSRLAQKLSGSNQFALGHGMSSETTQTQSCTFMFGDYQIDIYDTQGFNDNRNRTLEQYLRDLLNLSETYKDGFDLILYCLEPLKRLEQTTINEINKLGLLLGNNVFKHMHFVVTMLDKYNDKEEIIKKCQELPEILRNKGIPFLPDQEILFSDLDSFTEFKNILIEVINRSSFYKANIEEINIDDPMQTSTNPLLIDFIDRLDKKLEKLKGNDDESRASEIKPFQQAIRILPNSEGLKAKDILNQLKGSSYKSFQDVANYFLEEDHMKPNTFANHNYHKLNRSWRIIDSSNEQELRCKFEELLKNSLHYESIIKEAMNQHQDGDVEADEIASEGFFQHLIKLFQDSLNSLVQTGKGTINNLLWSRWEKNVGDSIKKFQSEMLEKDPKFKTSLLEYLHDYFIQQYHNLPLSF